MKKTLIAMLSMMLLLSGCGAKQEPVQNNEPKQEAVQQEEKAVEEVVPEVEVEEEEVEVEYDVQELSNKLIEAMKNSEFEGCYEVEDEGYLTHLYFYNDIYEDEWMGEQWDVYMEVTVSNKGITYLTIQDADYDGSNTEDIINMFKLVMK